MLRPYRLYACVVAVVLQLLQPLWLWADGMGALQPFAATGAHRASHREDRGLVAIIEFDGDYARFLASGDANGEARAVVAREFLRTHPDVYDFLVVLSTFEFDSGGATGMHWGVKNTVQGIGRPLRDQSALFGSDGRLQGYIDMGALARYGLDPVQPGFEKALLVLGHEVMHQWSAEVRFRDAQGQPSTALLGQHGNHWSDLLDTNASVLYGHKWRDHQDGTFSSEAVLKFFSPLDLYLAGWYRPDEVPPFFLIDSPGYNAAVAPQPGIRVSGTAQTITIEDIIAVEGPRIPAMEQAQKTLRFAFLVLTRPGELVEVTDSAAVEELSKKFAERFAVWTGGRAIAQVVPDAMPEGSTGQPETVLGGTIRPVPVALNTALTDGLAWLRQQQQRDGSWLDKEATQLRDSVVAFEALRRLDPTFAGTAYDKALDWLQAQRPANTDYQARRVVALGNARVDLVASMYAFGHWQNTDGGWGLTAGYHSDPLDTALAVLAVPWTPYRSSLTAAVQYLTTSQNPDGGWGLLSAGPGHISVTTQVLQALHNAQPFRPVPATALAWLARQQRPDGGFGEVHSTVHDTAQVLQMFITLGVAEQIRAPEAAAYLLSRQNVDGSWSGSTYATALAVAALKSFHFPNWSVEPGVTVTPGQPVDGERAVLTVTVRNTGQSTAPAGVVRFWDGDPHQGGRALGADAVLPSLGPGGSVTVQALWDTFGAAGEHTLVAVVDPEQVLPEVSEQDNQATARVTVQAAPAGVDLSVEALTVIPAQPNLLPTTLGLTTILRNAGMSPANNVQVQLREGTGASSTVVATAMYTVPGRGSVACNFTAVLSKPGSTVYTILADANQAIAESNEDNNAASYTVVTTSGVDLHVSAGDITITPQPVMVGSDVTFTVLLHNAGTVISPRTPVRYLLNDGQSNTILGTQTVQIPPGGSAERSVSWHADRPGQMTLTVQLDPGRVVPEVLENNNTASVSFTVEQANGPNLVVRFQDLVFTPEPALQGQAVTLAVLLRNTGDTAAQDINVAFYDGEPTQGGVLIGSETVSQLSAGASTPVSVLWPAIADAGDKLIVVSVDPQNAINEFSETDNTAFRVLEVFSLPDAVMTAADIQTTPAFPTPGTTVQVTARVSNPGAQAIADVVVRAFEGDPAAGGGLIAPEQHLAIPAHGVATAQFVWNLSGAPSVRTLVVVVDPDDTLREASELNNIAQKTMAVQESDFFVSNRYFSPNGDGVQDTTVFFFRPAPAATVDVVVVDAQGTLVRRFANVSAGQGGQVTWDGLDDRGRVAPDGTYRLQVRSSTAQTLGEALAVVDNNRSPLVEAVGTSFGVFTNVTCALGEVGEFGVTDDDSTMFLTTTADSGAFPRGLYRMAGNGADVTLLVPAQGVDIYSMKHSPDGAVVAYLSGLQTATGKLFVMHGDGTNQREIFITDEPLSILAVLPATQEILLTVAERGGARRKKLLLMSWHGGTTRFTYTTTDRFSTLLFYGLSPNRKQAIFGESRTVEEVYYVLDLATTQTWQIAASTYDFVTGGAQVQDIQWSPDGASIAVKYFHEAADHTLSYSLAVVTPTGLVRREIATALRDAGFLGHVGTCISLVSWNMAWSPDSEQLAFDLALEGTDECLTGEVFRGGIYTVVPSIGLVQEISSFDEALRGYYRFPRNQSLGWFQEGGALFSAVSQRQIDAFVLAAGNKRLPLLHPLPATHVQETRLSSTGRQLLYASDRDVLNPHSPCYRQGLTDLWSYKSLRNLTADLEATQPGPHSGIVLQGTASDAHFDSYVIEYAAVTAPNDWHLLVPTSGQSVLHEVFTTWVPPAPGTYRVRLTARDLAGNTRQQSVHVVWAEAASITDLHGSATVFSPNGDGSLEDVSIHYRVLEPVHLTFTVFNDAGDRVRTITRDHATVGTVHRLLWDGRDDRGMPLPDGQYRVQVQQFTLTITIDTTPPAATLLLHDAYQFRLVGSGSGAWKQAVAAPALTWAISDLHYEQATLTMAAVDHPDLWYTLRDNVSPGDGSQSYVLPFAGVETMLFRLTVRDRVGNQTVVNVGPVTPQVILTQFGDHEGTALAGVQYAPMESDDGPERVIALSTDTARFVIAESIPTPLAQVVVQYRQSGAPDWQEMALTQFLDTAQPPHATARPVEFWMQALWDVSHLEPGKTYSARLQVTDQAQHTYVSNMIRLVVNRHLVFRGLIATASRKDHEMYRIPQVSEPGKTGLWGVQLRDVELAEVQLILHSTDDARYSVERQVDRIVLPEEVLTFAAALAPCQTYTGYLLGITHTGTEVTSLRRVFHTPCLNMAVKVEPQTSNNCDQAAAQILNIHLAPKSLQRPLKLLTVSQTTATGQEDILFNVNLPQNALLQCVGPRPYHTFVYDPNTVRCAPEVVGYPHVFAYDTSAHQEGQVELTVRLVDIDDDAIVMPITLMIDHTPPTLALTYPPPGALVCGVPTLGVNGQQSKVVTVEGTVADTHGLYYRLSSKQPPTGYDSSVDGILPNAQAVFAIAPPYHVRSVIGPLAELEDLDGDVTVQLEVFDWAGFHACTQRTFVVDGKTEVRATVSRPVFAPGRTTLGVTYEPQEAGTVDVAVYAAQQDRIGQVAIKGPVLRTLAMQQVLLHGSGASAWDGRDSNGSIVPDGWYGIVLKFTDACGNQDEQTLFVEVDTVPPQAVVHFPTPQDAIPTIVEVLGTVHDAHLQSYEVLVGVGTRPLTWESLATGTRIVTQAVVAQWNTFASRGPHVLKLVAQDRADNRTEVEVPIDIAVRSDLLSAVVATPAVISPNGDGKHDHASVRLSVNEHIFITVTVKNTNGQVRRILMHNQDTAKGGVLLSWDGRDDAGTRVVDGLYTVAVHAALVRAPAVTQSEAVSVAVDTTPPQVVISRPQQGVLAPAGQVQGSITDQHLRAYTVSLTSAAGSQTTVLSSGVVNVTDANLGSVQGFSEGVYALVIEARDAGEMLTRQSIPVMIDNTPPALQLSAPVASSVVGRRHSPVLVKGSINEAHLAYYQVRVGAGAAPTTWAEVGRSTTLPVADVLGTWDMSTLVDGVYTIQVVVEDKAAQRTEQLVPVIVDNTPPTVVLTTPAENAFMTGPTWITGTASDAHLRTYRLEVAPEASMSQWSLLGTGSQAVQNGQLLHWQALPPDGAYHLRLTALDKADNSAQVLRHLIVDTTPPAPPVGVTGQAVQRQVQLTWQASPSPDVAGYVVYRDGQRLASVTALTYTDANVPEGRYTYAVAATDHAGLESRPAVAGTILVDGTPPQVVLTTPLPGTRLSGSVFITGTAYSQNDFQAYRVSIGAGPAPTTWQLLRHSPVPVQADVLAQWHTSGLPEGASYSIQLEATDVHGNVGTAQVLVTIDNQAPAAPTGLTATTSGAQVQLAWHANREADLLGYLVYRNGQLVNASSVGSGDLRQWVIRISTYRDAGVVDGMHTYTVVAMDQAGNSSAPSTPAVVTINLRAPHAEIVRPASGTTFDGPLYILATVADRDVAQVQFAYKTATATTWVALGSADAVAPYEASFDPLALGLGFGAYHLQAVATDSSGRVDTGATAITVTYADQQRPQPVQGLVAQVDGEVVRLQWQASSENDLAGYHIERQRDHEAVARLTTAPVTDLPYVDPGLADATYRYRVIAVDTHGNLADAAVVTALVYTPVLALPYTPTTAATVTLSGHGMVEAMVTGQVATGSNTRTLTPVPTDVQGHFLLADVPMLPGDNQVTLHLLDSTGNRSKPVTVTVTAGTLPSPPTGLAGAATGMTVNLSWPAHPDNAVVGYRLWRDGTPVLAEQPLNEATVSVSGNDFLANRVVDGKTATYWYGGEQGAWVALAWTPPRLLSQVQVRWHSLRQRASDFDLEAWGGQHWVLLAAVRGNQDLTTTITIPQVYRTNQLRLVLHQSPSASGAAVAELSALYIPLLTGTTYAETLDDGWYTYTLTAVNAYGFESLPSDTVAVAVGDVIVPEPVRAMVTVNASTAKLTWTASAASDVQHYEVYRDGVLLAQIPVAGARQYLDAGLANGTYVYTVVAVDRVGNASVVSNRATATILVTPPAPPLHLTVVDTAAGGTLALAWDIAPGQQPAGFRILRSSEAGGPYSSVAETVAQTWVDTGLRNGSPYYYVVRALDAFGNASASSNEAYGIPQDHTAPDIPALYFPTVPGLPGLSQVAQVTILGMAEPESRIELANHGQLLATVMAQASHEVATQDFVDTAWHTLSPDGRYVAYVSTPDKQVQLYDYDTDAVVVVAAVVSTDYVRWSADGRTLLFNDSPDSEGGAVMRQYDLTTQHLRDLTDAATMSITAAAFSPDGRFLLLSGAKSGSSGLWLQDTTTGAYRQLVTTSSAEIHGASLQWSPNGTAIAYLRAGESCEIVDVATGSRRSIGNVDLTYAPQWAPDGQSLLYVARTPRDQIRQYVLSTAITQDIATGLAPQWQRDGKAIVYVHPDSTMVLHKHLVAGTLTTLLQHPALLPETLQVVSYGALGIRSRMSSRTTTHHRLLPAGRFVVPYVRLQAGDNVLTASAVDASGNRSDVSPGLLLTYAPGDQADLLVSAASVLLMPTVPRAGERARVTVMVSNAGTLPAEATTVSLVALAPGGGTVVLLDGVSVGPLAAGERQALPAAWTVPAQPGQYTLVAVVDPDNTVHESQEDNNVAVKTILVPGDALPAVAVHTDAPLYHSQNTVTVTARISHGGEPWSGRLLLTIEDAADIVVHTLHQEDFTALPYGESLERRVAWPVGTTFAGVYQAVARLLDAQGSVVASATELFRITETATVSAAVGSDRLVYPARTPVQVRGLITYTAGNHVLAGVQARLRVRHTSGQLLAEQTTVLGDLLPGSTTAVIMDWHTAVHAAGAYHLLLDVIHNGQRLSQATGQLTIVPSGPQLTGRLSLATPTPTFGDVQTVTYTVTNHGNAPLTQQLVRLRLLDGTRDVMVHEQVLAVDLAVSQQVIGSIELATTALAVQSYTVLLQAMLPSSSAELAWRSLASQTFHVMDRTAPVVSIVAPANHGFSPGHGPVVMTAQDALAAVARVEFQLDGGPWQPALLQDAAAGRYSASFPQLAEGLYVLQARALDAFENVGVSPIVSFTVDNTPPSITVQGVEDQAVYQPQPYLYQVTANDADGDRLQYAFSTAPPDMRIDPTTGFISWWPQQSGIYPVTVQVQDAQGAVAVQSYAIMVTMPNSGPSITSIPVTTGVVQQLYVYLVTAVDAAYAPLTYHLEEAPPGMHLDAVTGTLVWQPDAPGDVSIRIRVSNPYGASTTQSFTLRIVP